MIRKVATLVTALACAAGLSLLGASSASALVVPVPGVYRGVDHFGAVVSFSFDGTQISDFKVGDASIGGVHVSHGGHGSQWGETCGGGYCFKGHWKLDHQVLGYWKADGRPWLPFSASTAPFHRYGGQYEGVDQSGLKVHFRYMGGIVRAFTWDHNEIGDAVLSGTGHFGACHGNFCFEGHWQTQTHVVGHWRYAHQDTWHSWEARGYEGGFRSERERLLARRHA